MQESRTMVKIVDGFMMLLVWWWWDWMLFTSPFQELCCCFGGRGVELQLQFATLKIHHENN